MFWTFEPNVAYHVHITSLSADFHITEVEVATAVRRCEEISIFSVATKQLEKEIEPKQT